MSLSTIGSGSRVPLQAMSQQSINNTEAFSARVDTRTSY
jgi:hypothetical protein